MKYKKTIELLIDFVKSLSVGTIVASLVGFILQEKQASWLLLVFGILFFVAFISTAILYERRIPNE